MKEHHGWRAKPGNAICAIDRGAIRFDYPQGWDVSADSDSLKIRDQPEPNDNCVFAVSQMHLPRELADQVPVLQLVSASMESDTRQVLEAKDPVEIPREDDIELAFGEVRFFDPKEKREAFSRIAIARGSGVYCLITFDYWVDDAAKFIPVWDEALRTLVLGMYIQDPTVGPVVN